MRYLGETGERGVRAWGGLCPWWVAGRGNDAWREDGFHKRGEERVTRSGWRETPRCLDEGLECPRTPPKSAWERFVVRRKKGCAMSGVGAYQHGQAQIRGASMGRAGLCVYGFR